MTDAPTPAPTPASGDAPGDAPDPTPAPAAAACPSCGAAVLPTDQFCESCGATIREVTSAPAPADPAAADHLEAGTQIVAMPRPDGETDGLSAPTQPAPAARPCPACGEGEIAEDGYCTVCGARAASERDHWEEQPAPWAAAVCDRGQRHHRNEDGLALAADAAPGSFAALVVCDGVTNSTDSDRASLAAAVAARDVLRAGHAVAPDGEDARTQFWMTQLAAAAAAGQQQAIDAAVEVGSTTSPPACTFVAVVLHDTLIVAGWAGDSRAYWLPDGEAPSQLSVDDSWATDQIAEGVPREIAEADSKAHSITKWLGVDSPDPTPRCSAETVTSAGWLLVCSDGLWNYCSDASALRALVDTTAGAVGDDPLAIAGALVDWANEQGGVDNIAVVLARVPAPTAPGPGLPPAPIPGTAPA